MSRRRVCSVLPVAAAGLLLTAQAPAIAPTPAATTSRDCPAPAADTRRFLTARAVRVAAPTGDLSLVAVRNEQSRARGLMCVVRVPHGKGMIFVFPPPDTNQGFWMKNTLVPLDMVFVTGRGIVSSVASNVPATPAGTPDIAVARRNGVGQFVIELGAGDAARHGIVTGTQFDLPALTAQSE